MEHGIGLLASAVMTLEDAQITTATLIPIFNAVKDNFMMVLGPLIAIFALKIGAWALPKFLSSIHKK